MWRRVQRRTAWCIMLKLKEKQFMTNHCNFIKLTTPHKSLNNRNSWNPINNVLIYNRYFKYVYVTNHTVTLEMLEKQHKNAHMNRYKTGRFNLYVKRWFVLHALKWDTHSVSVWKIKWNFNISLIAHRLFSSSS